MPGYPSQAPYAGIETVRLDVGNTLLSAAILRQGLTLRRRPATLDRERAPDLTALADRMESARSGR